MSTDTLAKTEALTPVGTRTGQREHATYTEDPCGKRVKTLCGRTIRATASWTRGSFPAHVADTILGHDPGACLACAEVAGLSHLVGRSRPAF